MTMRRLLIILGGALAAAGLLPVADAAATDTSCVVLPTDDAAVDGSGVFHDDASGAPDYDAKTKNGGGGGTFSGKAWVEEAYSGCTEWRMDVTVTDADGAVLASIGGIALNGIEFTIPATTIAAKDHNDCAVFAQATIRDGSGSVITASGVTQARDCGDSGGQNWY